MELSSLKNIGKELSRKLKIVGIENAEKLKDIGSKQAFFQLKMSFPEVCLVHLYALQGAVDNVDYNMLSKEKQKELKDFSDSLK